MVRTLVTGSKSDSDLVVRSVPDSTLTKGPGSIRTYLQRKMKLLYDSIFHYFISLFFNVLPDHGSIRAPNVGTRFYLLMVATILGCHVLVK